MSVTTAVYLDRRSLPSTASWQQAIDGLDAGLRLDPDQEASTQEGYWPATISGTRSGFELFLEDGSDGDDDERPAAAGNRDLAVLFVTHSDLIELKCALLAAVALARLADGVIVDEELDHWPTDEVEAEARSIT